MIFLGIYEFLAFLTALELFLLNEKYFSIYSKKTYILQKKIFSSDTALPKWLPVGQGNLTLRGLYSTISIRGIQIYILIFVHLFRVLDDHLLGDLRLYQIISQTIKPDFFFEIEIQIRS